MNPRFDHGRRWLERAGYLVEVVQVEPGIHSATFTHKKNSAIRLTDVARGVSQQLVIAHARGHVEEALAARPHRRRHPITPITIIATRYGGVYDGGVWAALPVHPEEVPDAAVGDDLDCHSGGRHLPSPWDWGRHRIAPWPRSTTP
jgi:hypothetical protein